jgi:hypothetical protein
VLVKELQGLGLKVDLVHSDTVVDAEDVLANNIKNEANHQSDVEVPQASISDIDVTEEVSGDEFSVIAVDDETGEETIVTDEKVLAKADESANDNNEEEA